ncbi:MAG: DUF1513 domain-containing protein [Alphaproteobacteria bacterium]|nr:DUF1513 domain-containing protein [Alphaproteobacteria bacterium]
MAIDRRRFMQLGTAALALWPQDRLLADDKFRATFASAARLEDGRYAIVLLTEDGIPLRVIPLEARGHDIAVSPDNKRAIAFARRPGRFAVAFNTDDKSPPEIFRPPADRHFYGHGVFSEDGRLLYATENDYENAKGVLGVYNVDAGFRRIGEISTYGVGPHDVLMMPDGRTLCVANGGIETHPAAGRTKLNLSAMRPSLAFIDCESGDLLARHETGSGVHKLSIRHLCEDGRGNIWFGGQWEGSIHEAPWLVGSAGLDKPISFSQAPDELGPSLKGYIGSVAANKDGSVIAATAPRAGRTVFIDATAGSILSQKAERDACGVSPVGEAGFVTTSGFGAFAIHDISDGDGDGDGAKRTIPGIAFDNHLSRTAC